MPGIITSKGLDDLIELKKKQVPLPIGWQLQVQGYIHILDKLKTQWYIAYLDAQDRYVEAIKKERFLNGR